MINIFLIVVGCYVLAGFFVHAVYRWKRHKRRSARHYVLLANPQHSNMERMIRSFFSFSRWMGVDVQLTVVDAGLSEQTREIIERLNRADGGINLYVDRYNEVESTLIISEEGRAGVSRMQHLSEHGLEGMEPGVETENRLLEQDTDSKLKPDYATKRKLNNPQSKSKRTASSLLWRMQADGVITKNEYPVVIDLQNPEDLSKIPF
ncbi:hypothetical protein ABEW34_17020 [Paenibacillus algorifonticola]|uniref:hypothetical protein n=1 Tax=Paenibacillus algorifonticola TaxID=684063 RepID=UPI003D28C8CB